MRAAGPSFLTLHLLPQDHIRRSQDALAQAQEELSTQRWHDVSLKLGHESGRNISWHAELSTVEEQIKANGLSDVYAKTASVGLDTLGKLASQFVTDLVSSRNAELGQDIIREQAQAGLSMLRDALNVSVGGVFPFAGRNQDKPPIQPFEGGSGQTAVANAFLTSFGFSPQDSAMQTLTGTQVTTFLNNGFADLFDEPNWKTVFSAAASQNVALRVGRDEQRDVLPNANAKSVRQLYAAMVSISELATGELSDDTFKALVDQAVAKTSSAMQGLGDMQARLGIGQNSINDYTEQLKVRKISLSQAIQDSEQVDSYEVATRINGLMTQLEASYSVTTRIARISLLNYL